MRIIQVENQVDGGRVAFELLKEKLAKGAKTLGLATGSSPLSFYEQIVESDLDLTDLTSVNLDEYIGLSGENPQSYRYFMQEHLFDKKPFKESFLPNGVAENAETDGSSGGSVIHAYAVFRKSRDSKDNRGASAIPGLEGRGSAEIWPHCRVRQAGSGRKICRLDGTDC